VAKEFNEIKTLDWRDTPAKGGPVCNFSPGTLSQIGNLAKPEGKVHFAGNELSTENPSNLEGAVD